MSSDKQLSFGAFIEQLKVHLLVHLQAAVSTLAKAKGLALQSLFEDLKAKKQLQVTTVIPTSTHSAALLDSE